MVLPETIRRDFGAAMRELRDERGISQEALALQAELSRSYCSAVENGNRNIGLVNVAKIAEVLGVKPSAIFQRAEKLSTT